MKVDMPISDSDFSIYIYVTEVESVGKILSSWTVSHGFVALHVRI